MKLSYSADDVNRIMPRLADVLSAPEEGQAQLEAWVTDSFGHEIPRLAALFDGMPARLHHKWASAILASLPESAWVAGVDGLLSVRPEGASLRFLSTELASADSLVVRRQVEARAALHDGLLSQLAEPQKRYYRAMLTWEELDSQNLPMAGDTRFGLALNVLENEYDRIVDRLEAQWRDGSRFPEGETAPIQLRCDFALTAMKSLYQFIESSIAVQDGLEGAADSLLVRVSANVSCNRALLEMAAQDARAKEAEDLCSFFSRLNEKGVFEVPPVFKEDSPQETGNKLRAILEYWFAYGGLFLAPGSYMAQHMTDTELDKIVQWSGDLQNAYIATRGGVSGEANAIRSHGGPENRFLFAMVLVAAFYSHQTTVRETQTNEKHRNTAHSVFPGRVALKKGSKLTTHAQDVLLKAYGLLFYSNRDWELRADRIRDYAYSTQVRRTYRQLAVNYAVKSRSSRELLALYRQLAKFQRTASVAAEQRP